MIIPLFSTIFRWMLICGLCGQSFTDKSQLRSHKLRHHQADNLGFCHICGKQIKGLRVHMQLVHEREPMPCHVCGGLFKHRRALEMHVRYVTPFE